MRCSAEDGSVHMQSSNEQELSNWTDADRRGDAPGVGNSAISRAREKARTTLSRRGRFLEAALDSIPDYVYAFDREHRISYVNRAVPELLGIDAEDVLGKNFAELNCLPELDKKLTADIDRVFLTGEPVHDEVFFRSPTGVGGYFDYVWGPVRGEDGSVEMVFGVSRNTTEQRRVRDRLKQRVELTSEVLGKTQSALESLSGYLIGVQEEERRKVARELHDDLGQRAALIAIQVGALAKSAASEEQDKLAEIRWHVNELCSRLRSVSHELHPAMLEDLGLEHAVRAMVQERRRGGAEVTFSARLLPDKIARAVATVLYRIAQEAVANAAKHAEGSMVLVDLSCENNVLSLRVEDNGPGFEATDASTNRSLGMLSMQERARLVGGRVQISSNPGDGTVVVAQVPLHRTSQRVSESASQRVSESASQRVSESASQRVQRGQRRRGSG